MRFLSILLPFFLVTHFANARQTQIFMPLQKAAVHKTYVPGWKPSLKMATSDSVENMPVRNALPLNFYSTHLGAMCKMEVKLEKQTKLPLRIRLGSKDQVDYLEGKYNRHP